MATIQKHYQYVLEKGIFTDCTFVVGPEGGETSEFKAHRVHIARASPVFTAMFTREEMEEAKTGHVRITDISPNTFRLLLNYIYEKVPETTSFQEAHDLAFAADKYQMNALLEYCVKQMSSLIMPENIWTALKTADLLENELLKEACFQVLQCDTLRCISDAGFLQASEEDVALVLEQDELNVNDELLLVNTIVHWARNAARQRGLSDDDGGVRAVLEPRLLSLLRLVAMSPQQFMLGPGLSGWLTDDEKSIILECLRSKDFAQLPQHLSSVAQKRTIVTGTTSAVQIRGKKSLEILICERAEIAGSRLSMHASGTICCGTEIPQNSYYKCAHASLIFRVSSICKWLGFQCTSRYITDPAEDPTTLNQAAQNLLYQEDIVAQTYTFNHSLSTAFKKLSIGTAKTYNQQTEYNSTISIMFDKPIPLVTDNWFEVEVEFRNHCKDAVEFRSNVPVIVYKSPSRKNKVCPSTGVEFIFRTGLAIHEQGYYTSKNEGIIESIIFSM